MTIVNSQNLPEIFRPTDVQWASRATARGELRRLARGLYTSNLDEPPEQLVRRRWIDVAALYYPGAVVVDRSAAAAAPASDGSLFLDVGQSLSNPRPVSLPGLTLRARSGVGPVEGDAEFADLWMSGPARILLENLRPSRARVSVRRTLTPSEIEERLDRLARAKGDAALNEVRDKARAVAPSLKAEKQFGQLDALVGALLGTQDAPLATSSAQARSRGLGYDTDRLALFESLRAELAATLFEDRPASSDPKRLLAFFEAYFSNWIEGTEFEVEEAERIVFTGEVPRSRPADAHDIQGTFEAIVERRLPPSGFGDLDSYLRLLNAQVMGGRPEKHPGEYKELANRAGSMLFVHPDLVRGTLSEGLAVRNTLEPGMARAIFSMFLVAEIHPFADGNGRVARLLMNAELTAAGLARIMVPLSYRDNYLQALRAMSRNANPRPLVRMLDRAQRWVSLVDWSDRGRVLEQLRRSNALVTPDQANDENLRLMDPLEA